ncbi:MAG: DUF255 domain-containing protein [Gammaproteobacteria bacterium]
MTLKKNNCGPVVLALVICLLFNGRLMAGDIEFHPPQLKDKLLSAFEAKGDRYRPRTQHLLKNGRPAHINRLILEDSPYLLQHAHNPVDWFPWGEEAFAAAKRENKPIFLSIGYSTCHWCHVMAKESFDNPDIAKLLNQHFISIKVDREQRPDIDAVYLAAVQIVTGGGGWPLSSFLTSEGKTFLGGTYFPPDKFKNFLMKVNELWRSERPLLEEQAEKISSAVANAQKSGKQAKTIDRSVKSAALQTILQSHDRFNGGFGQAPKMPNESWLLFLLDSAFRNPDPKLLGVLENSLKAMAMGGIYDQVGGGFHRYATDEKWRLPHYEKMLYNQALLTKAYLQAYRLTGDPFYRRIAEQTLAFVLEDMRSPKGAFYSAFDADSEEGEGAYYLWTVDQIRQALDPKLAGLAVDLYGVSESSDFAGRSILHLPTNFEAYSRKREIPLTSLYQRVDQIRTKLKDARNRRKPPYRDEKILTSWNAMMIDALAEASEILSRPEYQSAAEIAADFLWKKSRRRKKEFWRVYFDGNPSIKANQEDYAYLAKAFLKLYDVSGKSVWLKRAQETTDVMLERFWDADQGGFYMNAAKESTLIMIPPKNIRDDSIPAANAIALDVLAKLSKRTSDPLYLEKAIAVIAAFSEQIIRSPSSHASLLRAAVELNEGETGPHQYASGGVVSVKAGTRVEDAAYWLETEISIAPNWHINAHRPLQEYLIPTSIGLAGNDEENNWRLETVSYPKPLKKKLRFQKERLALYEGKIKIRAKLGNPENPAPLIPLQLRLQACSDNICLPPETLTLPVQFSPPGNNFPSR